MLILYTLWVTVCPKMGKVLEQLADLYDMEMQF